MESRDFSIFHKSPILNVNDNVYIVKYDGMNFQITKKKIIKVNNTYILDDNTEIDGEIIDKYLYDNYGIYSSKENAIKEIKKK